MDGLFEAILDAHRGIRPQVEVTPLQHSPALSALLDCEVWLKHDQMQPTGSFKIRGATNKMRLLGPEARARGVLTASTGNHGLAAARAGRLAGVPVTVYVSDTAVASKVDGIRALGARLEVVRSPAFAAEAAARARAVAEGLTYVSPYNDPDIVAGQGTLGVELIEQKPDLDAVLISVGGGGLIGGAGTAIKALRPETEVVGVWPGNSPCMLRALEAGGIVDVEEKDTLSDGTAGAIEPGSITYPLCARVIDRRIVVTETEIAAAMRRLAEVEHLIVEGSAGVTLAGLIQQAAAFRGRRVAVELCGRNIALATFLAAVSG